MPNIFIHKTHKNQSIISLKTLLKITSVQSEGIERDREGGDIISFPDTFVMQCTVVQTALARVGGHRYII